MVEKQRYVLVLSTSTSQDFWAWIVFVVPSWPIVSYTSTGGCDDLLSHGRFLFLPSGGTDWPTTLGPWRTRDDSPRPISTLDRLVWTHLLFPFGLQLQPLTPLNAISNGLFDSKPVPQVLVVTLPAGFLVHAGHHRLYQLIATGTVYLRFSDNIRCWPWHDLQESSSLRLGRSRAQPPISANFQFAQPPKSVLI